MDVVGLNGEWDIVSSCGTYSMKGKVPGSVLYELEKSGHFGDEGAFFRDNNRAAPGIMDRDFTYSRTFHLPDGFVDVSPDSRVELEAEGLDTISEIKINGKVVGSSSNMHRTYEFDVGRFLQSGENRIEIKFCNSLEYIRKEHVRRPLMSEDEEGITTIPGFYTIRKSHCSYGWDWGPQMPDAGIWRPISLKRCDTAKFKNLRILQNHHDGGVELCIRGEADVWGHGDLRITGTLEFPSGDELEFDMPYGQDAKILIENPLLWWPAGMGDQPLYTVTATLSSEAGPLGRITKRIGLRTLSIERRPDEWGESFHFTANGIPLFARGANYIPEDVYLNRVSRATTERLLTDCVEANFNCIRVWGGGVYPDDDFYDLCDRMGLIVWQDLMFACAIYDIRSDEFTDNISAEIRDNLERIRHHASLGLICGNNEMEWFFVDYDTFPQTKENEYEYIKQYHIIIPEIHREVCPEISYWSSSPSSGGYFEEPNSPDKGDCHFWSVWHGNLDFSEYKKHYFRFMSEFGFESLPGMRTIESYTLAEDRNVFSPIMEEHQKRVGGNPKIVTYLSKYFRYPKDLDSLAYVSQISQSDAIRIGVEHWRRNRKRCMGSIYWQLNDNWPVASWSSIDYYGRWKALHYIVKKAYDNILLSIDGDSETASVHVSNESGQSLAGTLEISAYSCQGEKLFEEERSVEISPRSGKELMVYQLDETFSNKDTLLHARFVTGAGDSYDAVHNFEIYKYLNLSEPDINIDVMAGPDDSLTIHLVSTRPALFVEILEADGDGRFSDNYFHLIPHIGKNIRYDPKNTGITIGQRDFIVRSLIDSF